MSRRGLVLAAHGSLTDATVNDRVCALAGRAAAAGRFDRVSAAFHYGSPNYAEALDRLGVADVTVVPLMTSEGYYCNAVLKRELARNKCYGRIALRRTAPVGTHESMAGLVAERVRALEKRFDVTGVESTLVVVGHGTPRHAGSSDATHQLVERLRGSVAAASVLAAFLDGSPSVEAVVRTARARTILVALFLIGAGSHATRDLPGRLGLRTVGHVCLPCGQRVGERLIACDAPVGTDPRIGEIVLDLATNGAHQTETAA